MANLFDNEDIIVHNDSGNRLPVEQGTILYGFCNGYFGRDSYSDKSVVAFGFLYDGNTSEYNHWIVAVENGTDHLVFASRINPEDVKKWMVDSD